jgi:hypothetical protein
MERLFKRLVDCHTIHNHCHIVFTILLGANGFCQMKTPFCIHHDCVKTMMTTAGNSPSCVKVTLSYTGGIFDGKKKV